MNEKIKLSKLESIQMNNFLMKKELTSYLNNNKSDHSNNKKATSFIINFIEDIFNIINQQILTSAQIYESTNEKQIDNLINNNKNISFNMIINFYEKIINYSKDIKNKNISRNFSHKKANNLTDRYYNNIFENDYFKKKSKSNFNSLQNSVQNNNLSNNNVNNNLSSLILSSPNTSRNESINNLKMGYIDLNKLRKDDQEEDIQIIVKSTNIKDSRSSNNINNKIILNKKIYKICDLIPVSKKNILSKDTKRKNSFNKKIKLNKINIKKSKNNLTSLKIENNENDIAKIKTSKSKKRIKYDKFK